MADTVANTEVKPTEQKPVEGKPDPLPNTPLKDGSKFFGQEKNGNPADPNYKKPDDKKELTDEEDTAKIEKPKEDAKVGDEDPNKEIKYDLKLPKDSPLNEAHLESVKDLAKTLGLDNEKAQLLLERDSKLAESAKAARSQWEVDNKPGGKLWEERVMEFEKDLLKEKEFGTLEAIRENAEFAKRAAENIGGKELIEILDNTGYGSHKIVLKALSKLGRMMKEDSLVKGDGTGIKAPTKTAAQVLFPNTPGQQPN